MTATPLPELSRVHYGSRPAFRREGAGTMAGIRAIPWVFGWMQIRLMLPGWLGVGTALASFAEEPGGLDLLRRMAAAWPFFDDLLGKVEMVCAKADPEIARTWFTVLGPDGPLFDELAGELARTIEALRRIRGGPALLGDHPHLRTNLDVRDSYVDPLSLLQIALLKRKRALPPDHPDLPLIHEALGSTPNGVAQGMRNTG